MTQKEFVPLAVEIGVSDFNRSLDFYQNTLGFTPIRVEQSSKFASFEFNSAIFMIKEVKDLYKIGTGAIIRFIIDKDLDKYYQELQSRSAKIVAKMENMPYGLRRFYVEDPDGYLLKFGSKV